MYQAYKRHIRLQEHGSEIEQIIKAHPKLEKNRIFSIDQIKSVCLNYRLRLLPTRHYRGDVDITLPQRVLKFYKDINEEITEEKFDSKFYQKNDVFYICAPKESFKLQERPKDPLFFHKLSDNYYYLIHKWGNDLSLGRWMQGFFYRNMWTNAFSILLIVISTMTMIAWAFNIHHWGLSLFAGIICGIWFGIINVQRVDDEWSEDHGKSTVFSKDTWNSVFKD